MDISKSDFWKEITRLSLIKREKAIDHLTREIETNFNCKIKDRPYSEFGKINNPCLAVQCSTRNICYLKEFVPN